MLSLRQLRRRIRSVENTKKMTRAMEMVAAAKLKKLQDLLRQSDAYIEEFRRILGTLVQEKPLVHPLLEKRLEVKTSLAFLITSDTGLCGSYNTNLLELTTQFLNERKTAAPISFISIGKNGAAFLKRRRQTIQKELIVPRPQNMDETIREVTQMAAERFTNHEADEIFFIYTKVVSLGSLKPTVTKLLPIATPSPSPLPLKGGEDKGEGVVPVDYLLEPSLETILEIMLPEFIEAECGRLLKNSFVAEQASRMTAMRQATDNAKEMIDSLTLSRNKARQAAITKELLEVVSGSRALQMR